LKDYEYYERVQNGDLNWIIPNKFVAFMSPNDEDDNKRRKISTPEQYSSLFRSWGVSRVIRLNRESYDKKVIGKINLKGFTNCGVAHSDLYFKDGSTPSESIIEEFL
jgi:cell division cycle 14